MEKIRQVVAYKHYFEDFLRNVPTRVQDKIFKIVDAIETLERIPAQYLKHLEGAPGLYEARIQLGSYAEIPLLFRFRQTSHIIKWLSEKRSKNAKK